MFKRILTLIAIVFAMSGLALAATVVNIDQTGVSINPGPGPGAGLTNWFYVKQVDVTSPVLTIDITQTAGTWNEATAEQRGRGLTTKVVQWATAQNVAITEQGTPGNAGYGAWNNNIDVDQTANGGDNYALILQMRDSFHNRWNDFRVKQVAGTYNFAEMDGSALSGITSLVENNKLAVDQYAAAGYNKADLFVHYDNSNVVRADNTGTPEAFPNPATQTTTTGNNELYVDQYGYHGDHTAGLYQSAAGDNHADIDQFGTNNSLGVHQVAGSGKNELDAYQGGDGTAKVVQNAATDNDADVYQGSPNTLVGADINGNIDLSSPATQDSSGSYNDLWTYQSGNNNEIGLYQSALGHNYAHISQMGDNNSLGVYMTTSTPTYGGFNSVIATQTGDSSGTVFQRTFVGDGTINVTQN